MMSCASLEVPGNQTAYLLDLRYPNLAARKGDCIPLKNNVKTAR